MYADWKKNQGQYHNTDKARSPCTKQGGKHENEQKESSDTCVELFNGNDESDSVNSM